MADARHQRRLPLEVLERRRLELAARLEGEELARRPVAQQVHLGEVAAPEDAERAVLSVEVAGGQVERAGRGGDARRTRALGAPACGAVLFMRLCSAKSWTTTARV